MRAMSSLRRLEELSDAAGAVGYIAEPTIDVMREACTS